MTRAGIAVLVASALLLTGCGSGPDGGGDGAPRSAPGATTAPATPPAGTGVPPRLLSQLLALESRFSARVGVYAVDTATGRTVEHRASTRFPYASTIKAHTAGAVLDELSADELRQRIRWTDADLVEHSPVTERHVGDGLTVEQLIAAAVTESDNTAANLLMDLVGGPTGLEERLRDLGDHTTSVDRAEPLLNSAVPGDARDTTTPRALATTFSSYVLGDVLTATERRLLDAVLERSTTGDDLVRAGVPDTWQVADKSGTAAYGTRNDLAVVRPPGRAPWVIAVMTTARSNGAEPRDALVAATTRVVVRALS